MGVNCRGQFWKGVKFRRSRPLAHGVLGHSRLLGPNVLPRGRSAPRRSLSAAGEARTAKYSRCSLPSRALTHGGRNPAAAGEPARRRQPKSDGPGRGWENSSGHRHRSRGAAQRLFVARVQKICRTQAAAGTGRLRGEARDEFSRLDGSDRASACRAWHQTDQPENFHDGGEAAAPSEGQLFDAMNAIRPPPLSRTGTTVPASSCRAYPDLVLILTGLVSEIGVERGDDEIDPPLTHVRRLQRRHRLVPVNTAAGDESLHHARPTRISPRAPANTPPRIPPEPTNCRCSNRPRACERIRRSARRRRPRRPASR